MADLWAEVYEAFSHHTWKAKGDTDPQSVLDRAADKCIKGEEDPNFKHANCRSFNPNNCDIEEQCFTLNELLNAQKYFSKQKRKPYPCKTPIIVLVQEDRMIVIDGNNRLCKWEREGKEGKIRTIIIRPK